jgi:hypothetical protein
MMSHRAGQAKPAIARYDLRRTPALARSALRRPEFGRPAACGQIILERGARQSSIDLCGAARIAAIVFYFVA